MSNTTIDVRTQKDIQKSAVSRDKFPVDFGRAWKWIGYSRKDIAKDALLRQFADSVDFKSFPVETGNRGRRREQIMLTRDCFKKFCMMAGTEKGREVREYYLKCESELHSIKEKGAMRTKSKVVRNFYTDTLQSHGITKKHEFIQLTSQPKQILGLDKKKTSFSKTQMDMGKSSRSSTMRPKGSRRSLRLRRRRSKVHDHTLCGWDFYSGENGKCTRIRK